MADCEGCVVMNINYIDNLEKEVNNTRKVLILNGCKRVNGNTSITIREIVKAFEEEN